MLHTDPETGKLLGFTEKECQGALQIITDTLEERSAYEHFKYGDSLVQATNGFSQDILRGAYWLTRSVRGGCCEGMLSLGLCWRTGLLGQEDVDLALRLWEVAAQRDAPMAYYNLGTCYLQRGLNTPCVPHVVQMPYVVYESYPQNDDITKGLHYLHKAEKCGYEDAAKLIERYYWMETNRPHSLQAKILAAASGLPIERKDDAATSSANPYKDQNNNEEKK